MKNWFATLESREKRFVLTAAVFLVFAIFYLLVWMPLAAGHKRMIAGVEVWQTSLERVKPLSGMLSAKTATAINPANFGTPLVVVIDSTLRIRNLNSALKRSQPSGNNIRVQFENIAFDELILWLGDLSNLYALQVEAGTFTLTGSTPGRVNAQLTLAR